MEIASDRKGAVKSANGPPVALTEAKWRDRANAAESAPGTFTSHGMARPVATTGS